MSDADGALFFDVAEERTLEVDFEVEDAVLVGQFEVRGVEGAVGSVFEGDGRRCEVDAVEG